MTPAIQFKMAHRHVGVARRVGIAMAECEAERARARGLAPVGPLAGCDLLDCLGQIRMHRECGHLPVDDLVALARIAASAASERWSLICERANADAEAAPPGPE